MARLSARWTGARFAGRPHGQFGKDDSGKPDTSHRDTVELGDRNLVAVEHLTKGRSRTAMSALELLVDECRRRLGDGHPETLVVEGNLAVAYVMAGEVEAGERLMLANLGSRERVFGDDHRLTLTARDALATAYRLAGRLSEAMRLYSVVAPQRNRVLGRAHPDTLTTRLGLGLTLAEAGETAVALDVVTAALQDCERAGVAGEHAAILRSCLAELHSAGVADEPETDAAADTGSTADGASVPQPRSPLPTDEAVPLQRDRDHYLAVGTGRGQERDGST